MNDLPLRRAVVTSAPGGAGPPAWSVAANRRGLRVALALAGSLVPIFGLLDALVAPRGYLPWMLAIRVLLVLLTLGVWKLTREPFFERHADAVCAGYAVLLGWGIATLALLMGGLSSPYYPGLMLVMLGVSLLLLLPRWMAAAVHGLIVASFLLPGLLMARSGDWAAGVMASFFLASSAVVAAVGQGERFRVQRSQVHREQELLRLRGEAEEARSRLASRGEQLREANQKLAELAHTDPLTGIPNRRALRAMLGRQWRWAMRESRPISLLMCDVDQFKPYNDRYGHQAGDVCLQKVAAVLQASVWRPTDMVARYGGEEFAVVLSATDEESARLIAERIREAVAGLRIPHEDSTVADHLTISIGIASAVPGRESDPASLLERADRALYRAKDAGRNRCEAG